LPDLRQTNADRAASLPHRTERLCDSASVDLATVKMDFHFDDWFPKETNVGCETSIYDVMIGDPTLFMRADVVGQGWRIMQPVLDVWAAEKADFSN
jgi:glucose-6-phosphate 1-dehydrogenase